MNQIVLMTDGVLDTEDGYFTDARNLYSLMVHADSLEKGIASVLGHVVDQGGVDSATIVCWEYYNAQQGLVPSD